MPVTHCKKKTYMRAEKPLSDPGQEKKPLGGMDLKAGDFNALKDDLDRALTFKDIVGRSRAIKKIS